MIVDFDSLRFAGFSGVLTSIKGVMVRVFAQLRLNNEFVFL